MRIKKQNEKAKFIPGKDKAEDFEFMSISVYPGEKELLIEHLNVLAHPYSSMSQFVRAGINKELLSLKSKYQLTIK